MNARSAIRPDTIWLRRIDFDENGVYLVLHVRSDIRQFTEVDTETDMGDGTPHVVFEYDEEEIRHLLPSGISSAAGIKAHIAGNRAAIEKAVTEKKARDAICLLGIEECRRVVFEAQQT